MPLHPRFAAVPLPKHSLGRIDEDALFLPKLRLGRGTVRRTVEGQAVASLCDDVTDDAIQIAKYVSGRDAQDGDPMLRQNRIAPSIPLGSIPAFVNLAIDLDGQPRRRAVEVQHIRPRRMLPAKPQPFGPLAEDAPQHDLGQRQITPESTRFLNRPAWLRRYSHRPSTIAGAMVPLPKHSLGRNED
ncbi:hypothetical protein SP5_026_00030 [Sphingomonas parapaucimobilis NBRC 15100]|uniref:Uncharacterized protein n=1 Tax=Sphingomonas parapaucimobilis NBRC 15100 TaxID=1219049 RepID=A0A0A1W4C8_9SPHN|nr:hypothetical protein SP5_026_00030 [Sphingomonas parapaucimobilis NBRC 15100]